MAFSAHRPLSAEDLAQLLLQAYDRGERCPPATEEAIKEALCPTERSACERSGAEACFASSCEKHSQPPAQALPPAPRPVLLAGFLRNDG